MSPVYVNYEPYKRPEPTPADVEKYLEQAGKPALAEVVRRLVADRQSAGSRYRELNEKYMELARQVSTPTQLPARYRSEWD